MTPIGVALVGSGFAASAHADALRRVPAVRIVGLVGSSHEKAMRAASALGAGRAYRSLAEMLEDEAVVAVHDCTPNHLHAEVNTAVLRAGKHLLSEKPLGLNSAETGELLATAAEAGVVAGAAFNYRHYPLVAQMRALLADELRPAHLIRGSYLQDWLLRASDWNWRVDPQLGGAARAVGDIGSHWLDLAQHVLGDPVVAVAADLGVLHAERLRPKDGPSTFASGGAGSREAAPAATEDFCSMLLRFAGGCRGVLTVSQVSAGRKNQLTLEIDTGETGVAWNQEEPNSLWIGRRDRPNSELVRDPSLLAEPAGALARLPGGHPEGWADALLNLVTDFHGAVAASRDGRPYVATFATFADAHRVTRIVEAILRSHREGGWVELAHEEVGV